MSATANAATIRISDVQKKQYREEGYFILENVVPQEHLDLLRSECQGFMDRMDKEMDEKGVDKLYLNHRGKRYFPSNCFQKRPVLGKFIFSDLMAEVCRATIGPDAYLFCNQYVVKCADKGMKFSWHQDSGYVHPNHKPYLTCWIPLDDVSEENGTVYVLPYSRAGIRTWVQHVVDPVTNDKVGYFGNDRGTPVICPAGSIVCFSSYLFHNSGANMTDRMRRVFVAQYSPEPIMNEDGSKLSNAAEPFLKDGKTLRNE